MAARKVFVLFVLRRMSNGRFTNAGRLVFAGFTLLHTASAESKITKTRCPERPYLLRKCGYLSSVTLAVRLRVMDSLFPCCPEREKTIADTNCVRLREAQREESSMKCADIVTKLKAYKIFFHTLQGQEKIFPNQVLPG